MSCLEANLKVSEFLEEHLSGDGFKLRRQFRELLYNGDRTTILGKMMGAGCGARLAGFSWRESVQLGAGMVSRGEVGLILATVGLTNGLLSQVEFSAVIGTVLFSTLVTPPLLRALFVKHPSEVSGKGEFSEDGKDVPDPVRAQ